MQNGSFHRGKTCGLQAKLCEPRAIQPGCHAAGHCSLSVSVGQTAFHLIAFAFCAVVHTHVQFLPVLHPANGCQ